MLEKTSIKSTLGWANIVIVMFFFFNVCLRNFNFDSNVKKNFEFYDRYILTYFGFFHRGWMMFKDPALGASVYRIKYQLKNNKVRFQDVFSRYATFFPSVWNEVYEDLVVRDDNNDTNGIIRKGFLDYQCNNINDIENISFEMAWIPLEDTLSKVNYKFSELSFQTIYNYNCK